MFQFKAEFEDYYCGARPIDVSRKLNPELQDFATFLARNAKPHPAGLTRACSPGGNGLPTRAPRVHFAFADYRSKRESASHPDAAEGAISPGIAQVQEPLHRRRLWRDRGRKARGAEGAGAQALNSQAKGQRGAARPRSDRAPFSFMSSVRSPMGQRTPLYDTHLASGAKLVDFGGWDMPVTYGSQIEEHHAVRRDAGMFDVSHMRAVDVARRRRTRVPALAARQQRRQADAAGQGAVFLHAERCRRRASTT